MGSPLGLSPTHSFPSHITRLFLNCFKAQSLFEIGKGVPLSRWPEKWCHRFHTIFSYTLLAVDCSATGVVIEKSKIMQLVAGSGVSATNPFGRGTLLHYCYESLVYKDLYRRQHTTKTYSECIMAVTRDTFETWPNKLPRTVIDRITVEHPV